MARSRGRGRGRRPTRGRVQAPGPSRHKAVTPPPTVEVGRQGGEGEDEHIQEMEEPPQPTPEMINQVLIYLIELFDQGQTPSNVFCTSTSGSGSTTYR